jgi:hypothetical protein
MNANRTIVSLLVTAALSLPFVASAAGAQDRVPGSTDEARAAAALVTNQKQPRPALLGYDLVVPAVASSTDEARWLAGQRHTGPESRAMLSDATYAGVVAGSTDEARAAFGRRLDGSLDASSQHVQSSGRTAVQ